MEEGTTVGNSIRRVRFFILQGVPHLHSSVSEADTIGGNEDGDMPYRSYRITGGFPSRGQRPRVPHFGHVLPS